MVTDEYTRLQSEFQPTEDEFKRRPQKAKKADKKSLQKAKSNKRLMMQIMMSATIFLSVGKNISTANTAGPENNLQPVDIENVVVLPQGDEEGQGNDDIVVTDIPDVSDDPVSTILVDCTQCNGTGILCFGDPNFGYDRGNGHGYAGCGGTGIAPCPDIHCNGGIYTCPDCNGTGSNQFGTCEVCRGRGVYPHDEFCMGTGYIECMTADDHQMCSACGGTGKIETEA